MLVYRGASGLVQGIGVPVCVCARVMCYSPVGTECWLHPDRIVYNALISACEKVLPRVAERQRISVISNHINSFPDTHTHTLQADRADTMAVLLRTHAMKGIAPDVITYNTLISACRPVGIEGFLATGVFWVLLP
eukprot:3401177-Amphidinium_carterae.1